MACLDSPHVKIRRAPEDIHAQARNFAERTTNGSRISLAALIANRYVVSFSEHKVPFWSASWNKERLEREIRIFLVSRF